jgi:hypothetical protein
MSQEIQIYNHMRKHKTITPIQALEKYGCFRLAARIADLRGRGHKINTEIVKSGEKRFARYRLVA